MKPLAWLGAIAGLVLVLTAGIIALAPYLAFMIILAIFWACASEDDEEKPP